MRLKSQLVTAVASVALCAPLASAHFDFKPYVSADQILTGGHDDEAGIDVDSLRVSGYDFGETPGDPYNIGDPGFTTMGASAFASGSTLRLAALPVAAGQYLAYWDGTGDPSFGPAPAGVSLSLFGSPTRSVTYSAAAATYAPASPASLLIGSVASNGALHVHLTSSIFKDGNQLDGSVPAGAYLISFRLLNPSTGVADSDPLYIVYNNGLTEESHDAAIDYATATLVPEPAALSPLALAPIAFVRRRRTRA